MLRMSVVAAWFLCALVQPIGWAQSASERKVMAFELSQQRKGSCVMPEMPAAITYNRIGANGQLVHTTAPCREEEGMCGMSLNTYANTSHMCIAGFRNQESCRAGDCKPGWRHRCTDGWWKKTETCLPGELKKAKHAFVGAMAGGNGNQSKAKQGDTFSKQIEALKPELDARASSAAPNGRCSELSPDVSDLGRRFAAIERAQGLGSGSEALFKKRQTIQSAIAEAGSLDELIRLTRAQIEANRNSMNAAPDTCTATSRHEAACGLIRLTTEANQRFLDWFLCHKRVRG